MEELPVEGVPLPEGGAQKIAAATTFEELFVALDEMKEIQGSKGIFTSEEVRASITRRLDEITAGEHFPVVAARLVSITSNYGLRQKVNDLLYEKYLKM